MLSRSHRWLYSEASFCCFCWPSPFHPLPWKCTHPTSCLNVCFWWTEFVSWWGGLLHLSLGMGHSECCWSRKWNMSFTCRHALQWLSSRLMENSMTPDGYLTSLNLHCIQKHMAPFIPIKMWLVSRFSVWKWTNPITLHGVRGISIESGFLYPNRMFFYPITVGKGVCVGRLHYHYIVKCNDKTSVLGILLKKGRTFFCVVLSLMSCLPIKSVIMTLITYFCPLI